MSRAMWQPAVLLDSKSQFTFYQKGVEKRNSCEDQPMSQSWLTSQTWDRMNKSTKLKGSLQCHYFGRIFKDRIIHYKNMLGTTLVSWRLLSFTDIYDMINNQPLRAWSFQELKKPYALKPWVQYYVLEPSLHLEEGGNFMLSKDFLVCYY